MYKDILTHMNVTWCAEIGLVIFVLVFVGATAWALTRKRTFVHQCAFLPLEDPKVMNSRNELNRHE